MRKDESRAFQQSTKRKTRMNPDNATFDQGVLWAVARIVELFDQPIIAGELLRQSGVDVTEADMTDAPFIAKAMEG